MSEDVRIFLSKLDKNLFIIKTIHMLLKIYI